ncbi:MAG: single-stranded DNA-binding protein [Synergistaceae bacterium]|nr:single-stranded DNA-binding protein [Synergistaceae bacterium]MBQ6970821.1 single-stranded DNA-binding protein [Synergistaceae bacterium]
MRGFNRAIIAGNLTRDPEVRYTVNKKAFARFGVAVNSRWRNANGELQENTEYINVVAWGSTAETAGKYLKKGSPVLVEGRIRTGSYDAKDGSGKRYTTEIWVDSMVMLGSREGGSGSQVSSGTDYGSSGGYTPSDDDFGKSIGESGFGGGGFSGGFTDDSGGNSDSGDSGIPF